MTIHDSLIEIKKKWSDMNPPNPFPSDFTIFSSAYGLDDNNLWSIFYQYYENLCIAKPIPDKGYEYIYNGTLYTIADNGDKALYVWHQMCNAVGWYCKANKLRWTRLIAADSASYDPITNYNMDEYAGSSSKTSGMNSKPGTITAISKVAPYDGTNADLTQTVTSQDTNSTSGYANAEQKFDTSSNPWSANMQTPEGNTTSISKLTRKGNIGVTTSQQMIESEYELRKHNILQDFMSDVAKYSLIMEWH